jgi:hypothetical protein
LATTRISRPDVGHGSKAEVEKRPAVVRSTPKSGHPTDRRQKGKLKVGVDIPAPDEIKAIIEAAEGRSRRSS